MDHAQSRNTGNGLLWHFEGQYTVRAAQCRYKNSQKWHLLLISSLRQPLAAPLIMAGSKTEVRWCIVAQCSRKLFCIHTLNGSLGTEIQKHIHSRASLVLLRHIRNRAHTDYSKNINAALSSLILCNILPYLEEANSYFTAQSHL